MKKVSVASFLPFAFAILFVSTLFEPSVQQQVDSDEVSHDEASLVDNDTSLDHQQRALTIRAKRGVYDFLKDIGVSNCIRFGGGSNCRKVCQGIRASSTRNFYCTGACEWSKFILTCICKNPRC